MLSLPSLPDFPDISKPKYVSYFMWRQRGGEYIRISDASTYHIYSIIRMLWNHSCPSGAEIGKVKWYVFDEYYTNEYLVEAFRECCREIVERGDLTQDMRNGLDEMGKYLLLMKEGELDDVF